MAGNIFGCGYAYQPYAEGVYEPPDGAAFCIFNSFLQVFDRLFSPAFQSKYFGVRQLENIFQVFDETTFNKINNIAAAKAVNILCIF